jgi:hypothetical protein
MSRILFFLLAGAFCLAVCLPLKSKGSDDWAGITFAIHSDDYGSGIWYDRQFDFPTGALFVDVPVWTVDAGLLVAAAIAFGSYAKKKIQEQRV